ncbi:hypothetical protein B0H19DRAFT_1250142 [Mycena capillaripes]|nr:hypothetical protein B0H19DRAFT_1250142 [Mycena capillaripes]
MHFVVRRERQPVFVLEIQAPSTLQTQSSRRDANRQIRRRIEDLSPHCRLDVLYGINAFGANNCIYKDTATLPPSTLSLLPKISPTSPTARPWNGGRGAS